MAGQIWSVAAEGGYLYSDNLSNFLREEVAPVVRFRQLCDVVENDANDRPLVGLHNGAVWSWNVYSKLTKRGREHDETEKVQESGFTVSQRTGYIKMYRNSVPYTGLLDDFSEQPIKQVITKQLKRDCAETLDVAAWTQFDQTLLWVQADSGTSTTAVTLGTDGIPSITNNVAFGKGHAGRIITQMEERNIPAYDGGDYLAIARPAAFAQLLDDLDSVHQYTVTGLTMIKYGEIGRYRSMRFITQTNIPTGGAHDSTTFNPQTNTGDAWNNGKSDWIYFMGSDTVNEGVSDPEHLRAKIPDDYGNARGISWQALLGFGLVHTDALNARILKWDSAA